MSILATMCAHGHAREMFGVYSPRQRVRREKEAFAAGVTIAVSAVLSASPHLPPIAPLRGQPGLGEEGKAGGNVMSGSKV